MKVRRLAIYFTIIISIAARAEGSSNYSQQFEKCNSAASSIDLQAECITDEIVGQKKRLNAAYSSVEKKLSQEDKMFLNKTQHEWITWRDDNYKFLAEHVSGAFETTRVTSLNFLLKSIFDRANELEIISEEMGK